MRFDPVQQFGSGPDKQLEANFEHAHMVMQEGYQAAGFICGGDVEWKNQILLALLHRWLLVFSLVTPADSI
jgi:hypothetical protein